MKNTVFPHNFLRPFLDCMPQLFFRPQYVWFPVHLKGLLIPLWYETLVVNWQKWLFTSFHQSRFVLSPNPIAGGDVKKPWWTSYIETAAEMLPKDGSSKVAWLAMFAIFSHGEELQWKYRDFSWWSATSPREPHSLEWGPSSFHTKIFRVERTRLKTGEKITDSL